MTFDQAVTYIRGVLLGETTAAFWTSAQVILAIQRSYVEIYTQMVQANEDHFTVDADITYVANQQLYNLPGGTNGTPRIRFVKRTDLSPQVELRPCRFEEMLQFERITSAPYVDGTEKYFLISGKIGFTPTPNSSGTVKIYYVPSPALPTTGGVFAQEMTDLHHEAICFGAVVRLTVKNRELLDVFAPHFNRLLEQLKNDTQRRQTQEPIGFSMPYEQ